MKIHACNRILYKAIRMKELELYAKMWVNLTNMIWSEKKLIKKTACCLSLYHFKKIGKTNIWWESDYPCWE